VILALLPESWFASLPDLALLLIAAAGMAVVIKGADWLVEGAAGIAKRLGMPEVVIGATIVSLGTTSPEAAVSVLAAFSGNAGLALGNGVGSIIADTGLIFGVGCLMARLPADRFVLTRQGWVQFGSAVMLAALCYAGYAMYGSDAALGRWVGVLFVSLLVVYMVVSVRWSKRHPGGEPHLYDEGGVVSSDHPAARQRSVATLAGFGVLGLVLVIFAGDAVVKSVSIVAVNWGVPDVVIASTLVALGTSLPELVVGVTAIRKGHPELLVGNVIGADILNVLFVIGASALAAPLLIAADTNQFLIVQLPTMLAMLVLFRLYIFKAGRAGHFSRWMGLPLVAMYVAFIVVAAVMGTTGGH